MIARVAGLSAPGRQRPLCTVDHSQRATIPLKPLSARAPEDLDRLRLCAKPGPPGPAFHRNPIKPGRMSDSCAEPKNQTLRQPSPSEGSAPISSEPAPSHRPWISARARPLADRLNLTTTRKRLARLVMFLNDPADTHFGHVDKWLDREWCAISELVAKIPAASKRNGT